MLLIELAEYIWERKGELTYISVTLFFLRKIVIHEIKTLFESVRSDELTWTRENLEEHIGKKYPGPQPILQRARTRYIGNYYSYLRVATRRANRYWRRRVKALQNTNWITLIPALLGVIKLILQPFGIDLSHITDQQVNDVANGLAALIAVWGVVVSHNKTSGGVVNGSDYQPGANK